MSLTNNSSQNERTDATFHATFGDRNFHADFLSADSDSLNADFGTVTEIPTGGGSGVSSDYYFTVDTSGYLCLAYDPDRTAQQQRAQDGDGF